MVNFAVTNVVNYRLKFLNNIKRSKIIYRVVSL